MAREQLFNSSEKKIYYIRLREVSDMKPELVMVSINKGKKWACEIPPKICLPTFYSPLDKLCAFNPEILRAMRKLRCPEDTAWAMSKGSRWICPSTQNRLLHVKSTAPWESVCACVVRSYILSLSKGDKYKGILVPGKMLLPLYPLLSWSSQPCSLCQFQPCFPKVTFLKPSGHLSV